LRQGFRDQHTGHRRTLAAGAAQAFRNAEQADAEIGCALQQRCRRRSAGIGSQRRRSQLLHRKAQRSIAQHLLLVTGRQIEQVATIAACQPRRPRQFLRGLEYARRRARGTKPRARTEVQGFLCRLAQTQTIHQRRTGNAIDHSQTQAHRIADQTHAFLPD
jgi:hypothetical protein